MSGEQMPLEFADEDEYINGLRADRYTRGQAIAAFAMDWGDFTSIRVRKQYVRLDTEEIAALKSLGEPIREQGYYVECDRHHPDGAAYWMRVSPS